MAVKPVGPKERKKIIEALKSGESQTSVAKKFGRSTRTISRIAHAEGIKSPHLPPKNANEARRAYAKDGRIRLIEKALAKTEEFLDTGQVGPANLYQWTMGLAVLIDKRRQEDDDGLKRRGAISELMRRLREGEDNAGTPDR